MKNIQKIALSFLGLAAFAGASLATIGEAHAADVTVTATVSANCTITAGTLSFGVYDALDNAAAHDAAGSISVTCTNGSAAQITMNDGSNPDTGSTAAVPLRRLNDGGTNFLSYSLFQDTGRTVVWGADAATDMDITGTGAAQSLTIYGRIAGDQMVPAGSYSDTVTALVTF